MLDTNTTITLLLKEYLRYYSKRLHTSLDINFGDCWRFAQILHSLCGGQLISVTIMVENPCCEGTYIPGGSHAFIKINDKYYDSETVNGVDKWESLPYFERAILSAWQQIYFDIKQHTSIRSFKRFWKPNRNLSRADQKLLNIVRNLAENRNH